MTGSPETPAAPDFTGVFIGILDRKKRPIFEGSRVHSTIRGKIGTVVYRPGRFVLRFDDETEMTFLGENACRLTIQEEECPPKE